MGFNFIFGDDVDARENSVFVGRRNRLNFIDSGSLTWDLIDDSIENEIEIRATATGSGSGENNTASNVGTGTGLFKSKVGVDLQFKSLTAGSSKLTITNNLNDVGLDVSVTKSDVGLGNVENTALSTWAGSSNITTLGTIATGSWNATTIPINKGGTGQTSASAALDALLPTQTGNNGKYLTTDGATASWATVTGGSGLTQPEVLARTSLRV